MKIPYVDIGSQYVQHREEILNAIDQFLAKGDYILNQDVSEFEKEFAKLCGVQHAIGVADGTAALSLVMRCRGIGPGDDVITAPNSFFASASSIVHVGARPIFADVLPDQTIDPDSILKKITPRTKAIIPVSLTGKVSRMTQIEAIAAEYGLDVIEDAAQSVGASYFGKKSGSFGIAGCFSLHPLKNLNAAGDAGIITTQDAQLAEQLRRMRNHGMIDRNHIPEFGYNCRLDGLQAAILRVKMKYLDEVIRRRRENAQLYRAILKDFVEVPSDAESCFDVYHLFVIQCDQRDRLKKHLESHGIGTSIHYPVPIHLYECSQKLGYRKGDFPQTEKQIERILSLPIHQNLTAKEIEYIGATVVQFYTEAKQIEADI